MADGSNPIQLTSYRLLLGEGLQHHVSGTGIEE
jgi:hypothetical protein